MVIDVPLAFAFNGSIVLSGLTSDQVLFNLFDAGSNYTTLTGGPTLTISTNGATTMGDFLEQLVVAETPQRRGRGRRFTKTQSRFAVIHGRVPDSQYVRGKSYRHLVR